MTGEERLAQPAIAPHRLTRMSGRDPHEPHRVATPLELLFDLTFVVAFGVAADEFARMLAQDRVGTGLGAFVIATFAICWAWVSFTWFASAYDTDDWVYRVMTMLQMVGVVILALGIPPLYASIAAGSAVDGRLVLAGYIVMRIALVGQWIRAARQDRQRRRACLAYALAITLAQLGWTGVLLAQRPLAATVFLVAAMMGVEVAIPWLIERGFSSGSPWHAHHIAERYGLLIIIALGEGVIGTVASLSAVVTAQGWSAAAVSVAVAGTGLTFGMWWIYFAVPSADLLHAQREKAIPYGLGHMVVFGSIVATGAGMHAAAYYIQHHSELGSVGTVLAVAIPVGLYIGSVYVLYLMLVGGRDVLHSLLMVLTAVVLAGSVALAAAGISMAVCLLVVMLAPVVTIVGFEMYGHRHAAEALRQRLLPPRPDPATA
jgi:low temperature requirement protein LtrA